MTGQPSSRDLHPSTGARFVFDTHVLETMLPAIGRKHWSTVAGDVLALEDSYYDYKTGIMDRNLIFVRDGVTERQTLTFRLYTYRQLVELVHAAGFSAVEDYGWLNTMPFNLNSQRLVLAAIR